MGRAGQGLRPAAGQMPDRLDEWSCVRKRLNGAKEGKGNMVSASLVRVDSGCDLFEQYFVDINSNLNLFPIIAVMFFE